MIWIAILFFVGLSLSAFFSGSETGFYRVNRVRLVLDGLSGKWTARGLLWFANNPGAFVATTLVGNNIANYLVSLALVLASQRLITNASSLVEVLVPVLLSPILFVYGELLPKYFFFQSPYLLLRRGGFFFIICGIILAPVSAVLYMFGRIIQSLLGQTPLRIRLTLARQELQRVLDEGQEAGLLQPIQRDIAQNLLAYGGRAVRQFCMPVRGLPMVSSSQSREEILAIARRANSPLILLRGNKEENLGYYRAIDLLLSPERLPTPHEIETVQADQTEIAVLTLLQSKRCEVAKVVDQRGQMIGIITYRRLVDLLLSTDTYN